MPGTPASPPPPMQGQADSTEQAPSLTLALTGDVMLGRGVSETIAHHGVAYPWGNVLPLLRRADLRLINLECALTAETRRWQYDPLKPFYFRAEPAAVDVLRAAGVDFACLANNHAADFGMAGLRETVDVLDRAAIAHAGAGANLDAAWAPARLVAGGCRVAVVACADYPSAWAATATRPGIAFVQVSTAEADFAPVERALARATAWADLVVFTIHWGPNMRLRPSDAFRDFARRVVEAGADLFWGHSAHVAQGIELRQGRPVIYDSGDFVDDYAVDPELRNDLSALYLVRARPHAVDRVELVPIRIRRCQANLAEPPDRGWFTRHMRQLCGEMGTRVAVGPAGLSIDVAAARPGSPAERARA